MIETAARVIRTEPGLAWVRGESPASCSTCQGKGCGASIYTRLFRPGEPEYAVDNPIAAAPGDAVVVGVDDGVLLHAVFKAYLLPLLALLLGALAGLPLGNAASALGGLAGLVLSALWLRRRLPPGVASAGAAPRILRLGEPRCAGRGHPPADSAA